MATRGRPSKLTPELQADLIEVLEAGNYRCVAAKAVGIEEKTLSTWMKKGKEDPDGFYGELRLAVLEAEAEVEKRMVFLILTAAVEDPKQAQWYLERKFHDRWGRKDKQEHTGAGGGPIQVSVVPVFSKDDPLNDAPPNDTPPEKRRGWLNDTNKDNTDGS